MPHKPQVTVAMSARPFLSADLAGPRLPQSSVTTPSTYPRARPSHWRAAVVRAGSAATGLAAGSGNRAG